MNILDPVKCKEVEERIENRKRLRDEINTIRVNVIKINVNSPKWVTY